MKAAFAMCAVLQLVLASYGIGVCAVKWDYSQSPVQLVSPPQALGAFDGYPARLSQPQTSSIWQADPPTREAPAELVISYLKPVAVTRFVNVFKRFPNPSAWRDIDVFTSVDGTGWKLLQQFKDQAHDYPQMLPIDNPTSAQFYKIAVYSIANTHLRKLRYNVESAYEWVHPVKNSMPDGSPRLATSELETYTGPTVGAVRPRTKPVQSEPCTLLARVVSPEAEINPESSSGLELAVVAAPTSLAESPRATIIRIPKGGAVDVSLKVIPMQCGPIPVTIELRAGNTVIDRRPYTLRVAPKLELCDLTPTGGVYAKPGQSVSLSGQVTNAGHAPARRVRVSWMRQEMEIGDIAPGKSLRFTLKATAGPGYHEGLMKVTAGDAVTSVRRAVICPSANLLSVGRGAGKVQLQISDDATACSLKAQGLAAPITGKLKLIADDQPTRLVPAGGFLAAVVPGGVFLLRPKATQDAQFACSMVPDNESEMDPAMVHVDLRIAVDKPRIMFRPHMDWYRVDEGPNFPLLVSGFNNTTRMMCIQTDAGTISLVPGMDHLSWGFTEDNEITAQFDVVLSPHEQPAKGVWRAIQEAPLDFSLRLSVGTGDWWDAYRHTVADTFKFTEPRQYTMPVTQMQMLTTRQQMSPVVWSERWQMVRSYPNMDFFFNFYGATYLLPSLYSWYLVTDAPLAKERAEKVIDWLLSVQQKSGNVEGAWYSQYGKNTPPPNDWEELPGTEQAWNPHLAPHATGSTIKTLLWYWDASGQRDQRVLDSAKRGAEWLLKTQREDGSWPYTVDAQGTPITRFKAPQEKWPFGGWGRPFDSHDLAGKDESSVSGAGQIWCAWGLWHMYKATGDERCRLAALKYRDYFRKTFMDQHRYQGYWEDVSGMRGFAMSWETYEASVAAAAFADMGEKKLALEAAKDAATCIWTRVISTRQYETCYGQTIEQSLCGPSQAQLPMAAHGFERVYEITGDPFWRTFGACMKSVNFVADPSQQYSMTDQGGWPCPLWGITANAFENTKPTGKGSPGTWPTAQFSWLALDWLVREGNARAPQYIAIDMRDYRGTVLGKQGRVLMPEEKCDVAGLEHLDINWLGYQNEDVYALLVMNHGAETRVLVGPHEAHLGVYSRPPRTLLADGAQWRQVRSPKLGRQYAVTIPPKGTAILIWDRLYRLDR